MVFAVQVINMHVQTIRGIPDDYNPNESTSYIMYLDMNNLYGVAMSEPLPQWDFKLLSEDETSIIDFLSITDDAPTSYIFEVDLD